jgi:hypothetical protein
LFCREGSESDRDGQERKRDERFEESVHARGGKPSSL